MFWNAVTGAMGTLSHWQVYVAGLEYMLIFLVPMGIAGYVIEKGESEGIGCLSMLLMPVFQIVALVVFCLTLAPIIFGVGSDAMWSFPWQVLRVAPWAFAKLVGVLFIAAILLALIPLLGRIQSLHTLVLGGIALVFVLAILESAFPGMIKSRVHVLPGFWFVVGLVVVGAVMAWIGMMAVALLATVLRLPMEGIGQFIMFPVGAVFGFIPVFIYGSWLGAQLKGGG